MFIENDVPVSKKKREAFRYQPYFDLRKNIAKVVSYVFHPLLMPLLAIILIFNSGSYLSYYPFEGQKAIYMIVILSTIVLHVIFFNSRKPKKDEDPKKSYIDRKVDKELKKIKEK